MELQEASHEQQHAKDLQVARGQIETLKAQVRLAQACGSRLPPTANATPLYETEPAWGAVDRRSASPDSAMPPRLLPPPNFVSSVKN